MSAKEEPPPLPNLITLNKGLKLAEQWVKNMTGDLEEAAEMEIEARPSRLGLGAKVPRRSQVGPLNDPIERRLHKKLSVGRKKSDRDEESVPSSKNEIEHVDEDDEENLDSRTNAFSKKRTSALTTTPKQNKKPNLHN
ncbi:uncharacterized protein LOC130817524 [Amaranthus tricolor]|uniref:uncharacterized protein LOC130817524 n=1 Tax=Amaranthus tricolor TaxID=29722 RepID=UPI0025841EBE|nr:uncharacterized protein LOC130817524 [Amaranthus tricolor]XP_057539261.1 uncharacterized protein LOC130817524 [Amaranthus tricolor]